MYQDIALYVAIEIVQEVTTKTWFECLLTIVIIKFIFRNPCGNEEFRGEKNV